MELGRRIDDYIQGLFSPLDEALVSTLSEMQAAGLPSINVSANEGKLLYMLTKLCRAKRILEIGTLGGYSTIWLARAMPSDGHLVTLEYSPKHAEVARKNIERAGLAGQVDIRIGAGLDSMQKMIDQKEEAFDLFFIDADKDNYPSYLELALKLAHVGSVILSDNLIRNGAVIEAESGDVAAQAIARFNHEIATNSRLESIIVPITRENTDGLGISIVKN